MTLSIHSFCSRKKGGNVAVLEAVKLTVLLLVETLMPNTVERHADNSNTATG